LTPFQGLKVLKEFKEETGYNHPIINTIKGHLSITKRKDEAGRSEDKELFYNNRPPI
jgi:hypothetical protein